MKITVSVVRFRPWAPQNNLQNNGLQQEESEEPLSVFVCGVTDVLARIADPKINKIDGLLPWR